MTRRENDDYPTHKAMLKPLLALQDGQLFIKHKHRKEVTIFEPCAGEGQLATELRREGFKVITNDIDTKYDTDFHFDAGDYRNWVQLPPFDWVVTNPPYSELDNILANSLTLTRIGVALLLRLSAYEPAKKRVTRGDTLEHFKDNMRYLAAFSSPRPRYDPTKKGTDSVTTAWFVWDFGWSWKAHGIEPPFQFITNWLKDAT